MALTRNAFLVTKEDVTTLIPPTKIAILNKMVNPYIIVDKTAIIVSMPFNRAAKDSLKAQVPFSQRQWNPQKKSWILSLTEENYAIAISVLKEHFQAFKEKPLIYNAGGDIQATFRQAIDTTSYYTMLGIVEGATQEEIKKGHRKLVLHLHPDRGGDPAHFRMVQKAYEILSNPVKRIRYDATRRLLYPNSSRPSPSPFPNPRNKTYNPTPTNPPGIFEFFVGEAVSLVNDPYLIRIVKHIMYDFPIREYYYSICEPKTLKHVQVVEKSELRSTTGSPQYPPNQHFSSNYQYTYGEVVCLGSTYAIYRDRLPWKRVPPVMMLNGREITVDRNDISPYFIG